MKTTPACGPLGDFRAFSTTEPCFVETQIFALYFMPRRLRLSESTKQTATFFMYSSWDLPCSFPAPWSIVRPVRRVTLSFEAFANKQSHAQSESVVALRYFEGCWSLFKLTEPRL